MLNVASTVLATGMALSLMGNSTPVVSLQEDFVHKLNYYAEANALGINNVSYNYMKFPYVLQQKKIAKLQSYSPPGPSRRGTSSGVTSVVLGRSISGMLSSS